MKKVICKNCDWKWDIEKDDKNPYLCHKCGYDNKKDKFDYKALNKWKSDNGIKEYIIDIRKIIQEEFEKIFKIDYPYHKIEKLVDYYKEEFDDYMDKQGWNIFQSDSPSLL